MKTVFYILIALSLFACEKEIELKVPPQKPQLVLNSLFEQGHHLKVNLSESKIITDTLTVLGDGAVVTVKHGDTTERLKYTGNGNYESQDMIVDSGGRYAIEAEYEGLDKVIASDSVPYRTPVKLVNFIPEAAIDEEGYLYSEIDIEFDDPPDADNYYEIGLYRYGYFDKYGDEYASWDLSGLDSDDPYVLNEGDKNYWYQNILLSDEMFNGETVRLKCTSGYQKDYDKKLRLVFRCISQNYYKYKKKLMRHYANQATDIWDGTGNPVMLYSNIENGYGIFAGFTQQNITINIADW